MILYIGKGNTGLVDRIRTGPFLGLVMIIQNIILVLKQITGRIKTR